MISLNEREKLQQELDILELKFELLKKEKAYFDYAKKLAAQKSRDRKKQLKEEK